MQHQRDLEVDYLVLIWGVGLAVLIFCCPVLTDPCDQIPAVVARKEEAWKAVKDVLRDVIDGQPKRGDFWDDYNNGNRRVYSGYVQTKDDALQAYGTNSHVISIADFTDRYFSRGSCRT